jgi:hypothetical protein
MISATTNYLNALAAYKSGPLFVAIEIAGYARVFTTQNDGLTNHYNWIETIDDYSITINDLDGGADRGTLSFVVQDRAGAVTSDFPSFVFEGKKVTVKQGFAGLAYADYVTLFTGYVSDVISVNSNLSYQFDCCDTSSALDAVIYQSGDDGLPTSGDHKKTVIGHPLDILIDVLENQIGLLSTAYNKTKVQAYRDGPFDGQKFVFHLDQSTPAIDFIKTQLLKPLNGYVWVRSDGKLDFNFSYPLQGPSSVGTLSKDSWLSIPSAEQVDFINIVQFKFDKNDDQVETGGTNSDYLAASTQEFTASIAKYGQFGEQVIEANGLRSAFQGFFLASFFARLMFQRYGLKALKFDQDSADAHWPFVLFEPGDIVAVTHPNIPDRTAGVVGITNKLFEVFNKKINFTEGLVNYTLLDAAYLSTFGTFLIAPNGEADYAAASTTDKHKYMFLTNDAGFYSNGDPGNGLG